MNARPFAGAPDFMTLLTAARRGGVSKETVIRAREQGALPCHRRGGGGTWFVRWSVFYRLPLLTVGVAARRIEVHVATLRRWIRRGLVLTGTWPKADPDHMPALRISLGEVDRLRRDRAGRRRPLPKVRRKIGPGGDTINITTKSGPAPRIVIESGGG